MKWVKDKDGNVYPVGRTWVGPPMPPATEIATKGDLIACWKRIGFWKRLKARMSSNSQSRYVMLRNHVKWLSM